MWARSTLICQGWKVQQKNVFFKSPPRNLVFPFYLLSSRSPLGLRQLWLKTNSDRLVNLKRTPQSHIAVGLLKEEGQTAATITEPFLRGDVMKTVTSRWSLHVMSTPKNFVCVIMPSAHSCICTQLQTILLIREVIRMHCKPATWDILLIFLTFLSFLLMEQLSCFFCIPGNWCCFTVLCSQPASSSSHAEFLSYCWLCYVVLFNFLLLLLMQSFVWGQYFLILPANISSTVCC